CRANGCHLLAVTSGKLIEDGVMLSCRCPLLPVRIQRIGDAPAVGLDLTQMALQLSQTGRQVQTQFEICVHRRLLRGPESSNERPYLLAGDDTLVSSALWPHEARAGAGPMPARSVPRYALKKSIGNNRSRECQNEGSPPQDCHKMGGILPYSCTDELHLFG